MANANDDELKEIREEILESQPTPRELKKKLIYDGRQYSLRLPKKFVEDAEINKDKDEFLIKVEMPKSSSQDKPKFIVELIRNEK